MRYDRQTILEEIGEEGQAKLAQSSILIIGMGGLGCPAGTYLAGAGIGKLGLLDHDTISMTNLHRQTLYTEADVGLKKAEVAAQRLSALNSEIEIEVLSERLEVDNARQLISSYDLVIDGTDNFETKYLINDACILENKPWVYASVYKHEGQISVFNYEGGPSYRCLFPEMSLENISCEVMGTLGMIPGIFGMYQAMEAVKMILKKGTVLSGMLKIQNLMEHSNQLIQLKRRPDQVDLILKNGIQNMQASCDLNSDDHYYLDVRELHEQPKINSSKVLQIPLGQLQERAMEIPKDKAVQVFCQSGIRSQKAIKFLRDKFQFGNLSNVTGGVQTIIHGKENT